jgi:hypothetical protein
MRADAPYDCQLILPNAARWRKNGLPPSEADMLAPITHFLPLTTIIRKRMLPCDGRILVKVGQKVNATDILGEAVVGRKHLILDIAQGLRVSPRRAATLIQIKKGQKVSQDQVIAESTGFFAREVKAPAEGRVVALGGGKLVLETGGTPISLIAGLQGVVTEVLADRGVVIRASGSLLQGLWGNGQLEIGVLMSVMDRSDQAFDADRLDVSIRSSIILGGYVDNPAVFKSAIDLPVKGLILASMLPELLPLASQAPFPIMLVDGFGRKPMNTSAYKLLSTSVRREVTLNAVAYDRFGGDRPEVFISLPVSQEPLEPREMETFLPNQIVRVVSLTGPARIGTLIRLSPNPTSLPNSLRVKTAEVQLETGQQILVPLTNLEVLV